MILYHDIVWNFLGPDAREKLRLKMLTQKYEYQSDFARKYFGEGKAAGKAQGEAIGQAKAVLGFLAARGLPVPDAIRDRVLGCTDLATLDRLVRRAVTAASAEQLFDAL